MIFGDLTAVFTSFNSVFTIVAGLSAAIFGFFAARSKINIVSLEDSNRILREANQDKDLKITSLTAENKSLKRNNEALENIKTQAPQINDLAVQLATQHKAMMKAFAEMTKEIGNLAKIISKDV